MSAISLTPAGGWLIIGYVQVLSWALTERAALAGALANKHHAVRCSPNGNGHGLLRACPIRA